MNAAAKFSYTRLGPSYFSWVNIQPFKNFGMVFLNESLFSTFKNIQPVDSIIKCITDWLDVDGLKQPSYIAMAYAGHQFGHFSMLGDGRACLLAELRDAHNNLFDLHVKGSGPTPYARSGDGNATLGPMAREYLVSEAMHALGIPTTRSLAVIITGNKVFRDTVQDGAMLLRVASSHLRVGTFQYAYAFTNKSSLRVLLDYAIERHYPDIRDANNPALAFLEQVLQKQIELICHWQRVGFIHGVMNTDNTTISGETIDYGPCAFMDDYHPDTVFSSIDIHGRYAFSNQPDVLFWNLSRLAETLLPLIDESEFKAIEKAQRILEAGRYTYQQQFWQIMAKKIGFSSCSKETQSMIEELLTIMQKYKLDYTNTFVLLASFLKGEIAQILPALSTWANVWRTKIIMKNGITAAEQCMRQANPEVIPRNHLVEEALRDLTESNSNHHFMRLLSRLRRPYTKMDDDERFQSPPDENEKILATFCGT